MKANPPLESFGIDEKPRFVASLILAFQFIMKFGEMLVCPILLARIVNANRQQAIGIMSMSLLAGAAVTIAQAWKRTGPGYLAPSSSAVQYFAATLATAKFGGMAMVSGMLIISGLFQVLLTPLFRLFRKLLTPSVAGFVVILMAMWLGGIGIRELFQPNQLGQLMVHSDFDTAIVSQPTSIKTTLLGFACLFIMLSIRFWSPKRFRAYSILIGIAIGWTTSMLIGGVPNQLANMINSMNWFSLPHYQYYGFSFSWSLLPAYLLAGFISLKTVYGMYGSFQAANHPHKEELNMKKISHANVIAGGGIALSGLIGAYPQNLEPGIAAMQHTTGVFSRYIAFFYAVILIALAFCPKIQAFFLMMPAAINGATMLYFAALFFVTGLYMLNVEKMAAWEMQALALSIVIGSSLDIIPAFYKSHILAYLDVTTPALTASVITYLILKAIFSIKHKNSGGLS